MTDCDPAEPLGHRPPPPWYGWTIKLALAAALLLLGVSMLLQLVYVAPTSKANADAVRSLAAANAVEKRQGACFDRMSSAVTDGNAAVLAALTVSIGSIGDLVVALSAQPRDPAQVTAIISRIDAAGKRNAAASGAYDAAVDARKQWVTGGRRLPCPVSS